MTQEALLASVVPPGHREFADEATLAACIKNRSTSHKQVQQAAPVSATTGNKNVIKG